ncbi:MAG: hypothetical protein NWE89_15150 [Candidatus Bathyarchaeota archaeon]|nr:hypothetical protein [Candidatus Bathyarchaeota archaeon]
MPKWERSNAERSEERSTAELKGWASTEQGFGSGKRILKQEHLGTLHFREIS